ncbi:WD40 repeat domain-containing protein [bacterium]|nr:WD40 repeat domain-containing protein [bacterium]
MLLRALLLSGLFMVGCARESAPTRVAELEIEQVEKVAFGPDSHWLVAGNAKGQVAVFDSTGHKKASPLDVKGMVSAVAVALGKLAVSGALEPTVLVWDVNKGSSLGQFTAGQLAVASREITHHAIVWVHASGGTSNETKALVGGREGGNVNFLAFGAGGRLLVNDAHGQLSWWDEAGLKRVGQLPQASKNYGFGHAALSPDGTRVAASGYGSSEVSSFELAKGNRLFRWPGLENVSDLAYSPDGSTLAMSARGGVYLADSTSGASLAKLEGGFQRIVFRPDGQWLAGSGNESGLWDVKTQSQLYKGYNRDIAFVGNSGRIFSLQEDQAVLYDVAAKKSLAEIKGDFQRVIVSPDGKLAVLTPRRGKPQLWSIP